MSINKIINIIICMCTLGLIMTAFDSLTPNEQLLLKCSAVMGHNFPRSMLESALHFYKGYQIAQSKF